MNRMYYIAFSIHGTNRFTIAQNWMDDSDMLPSGFSVVKSRNPSHQENVYGTKMHWTGLLNKKTKKPLISKTVVAARFRELEKMGWKIIARAQPHRTKTMGEQIARTYPSNKWPYPTAETEAREAQKRAEKRMSQQVSDAELLKIGMSDFYSSETRRNHKTEEMERFVVFREDQLIKLVRRLLVAN